MKAAAKNNNEPIIASTLRLSRSVREKIKTLAKKENRSQHSQIVHIVESYLKKESENGKDEKY